MYHTLGLHSPYHSLLDTAYFRNRKQNLPSTGNAGAETVPSLAIKHHVMKQHSILAMVERKLRVSDLN